jgi:predicted cupin superfamily sugar epimerase
MHRLASDELFHFYLGDPVEMLQLWPDGSHRVVVIGPDLEAGQRPSPADPGEPLKYRREYVGLGRHSTPRGG